MVKIDVPLYVLLPRKTKPPRKEIINLNNYRNWQHFLSNQVKQTYKDNLKNKLEGLVFEDKISLYFVLHMGTKRKVDRANVLSIHEKFFCDALTEFGCIPDDNDQYIDRTIYSSGCIDKKQPRVSIYIYERGETILD